jgi:hypothetical protein
MKREVWPAMLRIDLLFGFIIAASVLASAAAIGTLLSTPSRPVPEVTPETPPTIRVPPNAREAIGAYTVDDDEHPEFAAVFEGDVLINGSLIVMGPDGDRVTIVGRKP